MRVGREIADGRSRLSDFENASSAVASSAARGVPAADVATAAFLLRGTVPLVVESSRSEGDKTVHRKKRDAPSRRRGSGPMSAACVLERISSPISSSRFLTPQRRRIDRRQIDRGTHSWTTSARAFLDLFSSSIFFRPRVVHVSLRFGGTLTRSTREREREREGGGEDGRGRTWIYVGTAAPLPSVPPSSSGVHGP